MEQENQNTQEPIVSDVEMKMPEDHYSAPESDDNTTQLGIILGVLIVLLVLILGGLYLWGSTMSTDTTPQQPTPAAVRPTPEENNEPESTTADAQVQALETVSTSNEIGALEADIESTNLDELDAELEAIDAELEAEMN